MLSAGVAFLLTIALFMGYILLYEVQKKRKRKKINLHQSKIQGVIEMETNIKRFEVQVTPQVHNGSMAHYWHVYVLMGNDKVTIEHGWSSNVSTATNRAYAMALR